MSSNDQESLARSHFMVLSVLRATGVVLMLLGMGIIGTGLIQPSDVIGTVVFVAGMLESMIVPRILIRKWRTPPGP